MRFFFGLIIGLIIAGAVVWFCAVRRGDPTARNAAEKVQTMTKDAGTAVQKQFNSMDLSTNDIKEELARTGRVIRRKAQEAGNAIADATLDARTTATIKGKILADPDLSVLSISVNTTNGRVTLSGTASSPENIKKAMQLALDTQGVQEVVSTMQVN